ncbi:MAG: FAD-dependent tricarballylate dehydrogenase TcuA [Betaproteobacteria bacterium]|nr:FAD-dependent tricarballylate dehydrogenase TcuA [Betaproteobacteria bacterium]
MNDKSYDVIVVGAGNAALCAALAAREQGASALVLERAPQAERGGNTTYAGGGLLMVHHGLEDIRKFVPDLTQEEIANTDFGEYTTEQYLDLIGRMTEYRIDPDLAETLVRRSTDTVEWIRRKGIRFVPMYGINSFKQQGRTKFFGGLVISVSGGGQGLIAGQIKAAEKLGVAIRYNARATSLLHGQRGVEGIGMTVDRIEQEIRAPAVVLACGGFEANREWRARYLGPGWDLAKVRGTRYNTGDGLRMALAIGAQPYGHWSGVQATPWDLNAPESAGDLVVGDGYHRRSYPLGIMLNKNGVRFLDEGADFANYNFGKYGRIILEQPGHAAWQIFDSKVLHLLNKAYRIRQAAKVTADSLEELVGKIDGVNKQQPLKTVKEYNAAVKRDVPFDPTRKDGRGTESLAIPKSNWASTIDTPPFEAYGVTCGITFTFGGLKITPQAEVVDIEEKPIPGLYAAGEMVGGIFYFNFHGVGAGLTCGAVMGRVAGENAAHYAARRQSQ